jgi:hypothetical protein
MSSVLFFDPSCLRPYDTRTLRQEATGGTEACVTRIADALGAFVMQHNRTEAYGSYLPPGKVAGIEHVVLARDSRALPRVRELYPNAKVYLWVHDRIYPGSKRGRRLASTAQHLRELAVTVICVSDTQRRGVEATLQKIGVDDRVHALTIYNPVADDLVPDGLGFDERKLVFFSSPNKGLAFTLDAFRALRRRMPDLRLQVGNPGYKTRKLAVVEGVEYLGPQPQDRIHKEVRSALCTFFPNFVIPETFGLVFAESKAVGTPVLTCDCGAAAEIVCPSLPLKERTRRHSTACLQAGEADLQGSPTSWDCSMPTSSASARGAPEAGPLPARILASTLRWLRIGGARCWGSHEAVVGGPLLRREKPQALETRLDRPQRAPVFRGDVRQRVARLERRHEPSLLIGRPGSSNIVRQLCASLCTG